MSVSAYYFLPAQGLMTISLLIGLSGAAHADENAQKTTGPVPDFVEEAANAGIDHVYDGPWEYFVGGGAAALDCNGDRRPDLFLAGGAGTARLFVNRSKTGGSLSFEEQNLTLSDKDMRKVLGAYPLDIDNDGHTDLAVLRVGENLLLKGGPDCQFETANRAWGFDGGQDWTTAFSAVWEKDKPFPTLAFGNYVDRSAPGSPWGTCHNNVLARPGEKESPDYAEPFSLSPGHCALSMLFTDWNRSGEPALRVSNDRHYYRGGEEQLWFLPPERAPRLYRRADGWERLKIWGMGIAAHDLNADGFPEYLLTSMGDTKLQTLDEEAEEDRPVYRDVAFEKGATAHRPYTGDEIRPSTGWHADFQDFNNDSLIDIYIAKGNVEAMPDFAAYDPDNLLLGNWEAGFAETGKEAGIALNRRGRGAVVADFNLDGLQDLVVVNRAAPVSVFRNRGQKVGNAYAPMGNWLGIELKQKGPNANAVGARISVRIGNRSLVKDVEIGGGHASGTLGFEHFGVGTAERAQIRIRWPDGSWSHGYRVFTNAFVVIERDNPNAIQWHPE